MKVILIGKTKPIFSGAMEEDKAAIIAGQAAAVCTDYYDAHKALMGALACGHESVIEHVTFTFEVSGVSRSLLAQITRHRLASFSVQSQRYVNQAGADFVVPPSISGNPQALAYYLEFIRKAKETYVRLNEIFEIPEEDARFVLPESTCTKFVMTMNARELRHFLELRMCNRAQWEIRELADKIFAIVRVAEPDLFRHWGCACMQGKACPEGKRTCGHPRVQK